MRIKKRARRELASDKVQIAIRKTNEAIEEMGVHTRSLYESLRSIQELFDNIRNVPSDQKIQYEKLKKIRLNWRKQAEKIEKDYQLSAVKNAGAGITGAGIGVAVVTMGPTVAMGVATTFGAASTGTAISALSGAAATNAAMAWLGGGVLAAGGGGMVAGEILLSLAGPIGWSIAGLSLVTSGLFFWKRASEKKRLNNLFTMISDRDVKVYSLAIVELKERTTRIIDENRRLNIAIETIESFGLDYSTMTDAQQYELGAYVNLMFSSTQLLISPIKSLLPKFSVEDLKDFLIWQDKKTKITMSETDKSVIMLVTNLLYKIELDDRDKKILWQSLKKNKEMLGSMQVSKREFDFTLMDIAEEALNYKYAKLKE